MLIITIDTNNKVEAYKAVSRLGFQFKVVSAEFEGQKYQFAEEENKKVKDFLSNQFKGKITNV